MARVYSLDLREHVVGGLASDETYQAMVELHDFSVASVVRWPQWSRSTGSARPSRWAAGDLICLRRAAAGVARREACSNLVRAVGRAWRTWRRGILRHALQIFQAPERQLQTNVFGAEQDRPDIARRRGRWKPPVGNRSWPFVLVDEA